MRTVVLVAAMGSLLAFGADKNARESTAGAENDKLEIQARVILDKDEIAKELGVQLPEGIIAIEITATPHGEEPVSFGRDDFTLVSHRDGQRSGPYAPSQIAGNDVLVVRQTVSEGGAYGQNNGPIWGGAPGTMGRPRQMPGSGSGIGTAPGQSTPEAQAQVKTGADKGKPNPVLDALQAKTLPDSKEIKEPIKGFLYFPLEGKKQKTKDLELLYRGPGGRLEIPFK